MKALFRTVSATCTHGQVLPVGHDRCWECAFEDQVFEMKPPFTLECTDASGNIVLEKGSIYAVQCVVRDAMTAKGRETGVLLKQKGGGWLDEIFPISRFDFPTPMKGGNA